MKMLVALVVAFLAVSGPAPAAGLPAGLETKAQAAFADIAKAKVALDAGKSKTSQSWLAKAEGLLKSTLDAAPGAKGLLGKVGGQPNATESDAGQGSSGLSKAETEAAKLNPSIASRLGVPAPDAQATADAGTSATSDTSASGNAGTSASANAGTSGAAPSATSSLSGLVDVYRKVSLARSLLKTGDNSQAKSLLDQIPASPLDVLGR
jgi:hypothetical protein